MRAVNLLTYDPGVRTTRLPAFLKPTPGISAGIVASLLILSLGVAYLGASRAIGERQREVSDITAEERALVARNEGARNEQALVDREQRDAVLEGALAHRVPWDQVLQDVARVLPAQVSVKGLSVQAPLAPTAAAAPPAATGEATAPSGFVLSGVALTQPAVALVLDRLELVPSLVGVQLQSSTKTAVGEGTARAFTVAAGIQEIGVTP